MDPDTTWTIINDENADADDRAAAALDMFEWLITGGFLPAVEGMRPNTIGVRNVVLAKCRAVIETVLDRPLPLDMERYV